MTGILTQKGKFAHKPWKGTGTDLPDTWDHQTPEPQEDTVRTATLPACPPRLLSFVLSPPLPAPGGQGQGADSRKGRGQLGGEAGIQVCQRMNTCVRALTTQVS